jgi:cardiolipin synthase
VADQAFSRAAGAPLIDGNQVQLLKNAQENYPAWLAAIGRAQQHIHFESYIVHEDDIGREFAEALIAKARAGLAVRLIYDWMGGFAKTSRHFWNRLRLAGVEVRCYNPPRWDSPLGWLSRDHRKMLTVDGQVGFIAGLCVGQMWIGDPEKKMDPWRDTGIEVRGPAVAAIEKAFAEVWAMLGSGIPATEFIPQHALSPAGDVSLRVVATLPATAGLFSRGPTRRGPRKKEVMANGCLLCGNHGLCASSQSGGGGWGRCAAAAAERNRHSAAQTVVESRLSTAPRSRSPCV